ncbi:MarR family winged helix-turn-helix transcriptional regulator [Brachybacterium sp. AOP43-C2-M15]|uniref:MarR family winged helix-turn-helix transcriptional regulator n=1 Tax=Brachybacterium sp. AOP43-C2-M15 TaxID=3457661 RepID=UPI00403456EE
MTDASRPPHEGAGSSYWYGEQDSAVALLGALRTFRRADQEMRRRMSAGMDMNTTDLGALHFVISRELADDPASPRHLAEHLQISGASTSKLLDRLEASGHLERTPHPRDGRSRVVIATDRAHSEVRERLSGMHERMLEIARSVPAPARDAAITFLLDMARELESDARTAHEDPMGDAAREL